MKSFDEMIRLAMYATDLRKITIGNVVFSFSKGELTYSLPIARWDSDSINRELAQLVKMGIERANAAIQ